MRQEDIEIHVDNIFSRLDTNRDGVVTIDEFTEACQRVSVFLFGSAAVIDYRAGRRKFPISCYLDRDLLKIHYFSVS